MPRKTLGSHVVLGATGKTGIRLCANLLSQGQRVRALGRDAARLSALRALGADCAKVDILDSDALYAAFSGASSVYLMSPTGPKVESVYDLHQRMGVTLAAAIEKAEITHAVLMSACGVHREANNPLQGMRLIESTLCAVPGLNLAMLRPGYFMENFYAWFGEIVRDDSISNVINAAQTLPMIATRDIANAAARLMIERSFSGAVAYELLGPRDLTMAQATAALGKSIGKPNLQYRQCEPEHVEQMLKGFGYGSHRARYLVNIFRAFDQGLLGPQCGREEKSTTPTTIERFASEEFAAGYRAFVA